MKKKSQYQAQRKKKSNKIVLIAGIAVAALLAIGATTYYLVTHKQRVEPTNPSGITGVSLEEMKASLDVSTIYDGIFINGQDVSGKTREEVLALFNDSTVISDPDIRIVLRLNGQDYPLHTDGLVLMSNASEIVEEAYQYGRSAEGATDEDIIAERYRMISELRTTPKYFQTAVTLSEEKVASLVHEVLDPLLVEVKEATVTGFDVETLQFIIEDSSNGFEFDIDTVIQDVKNAIDNGEYEKTIGISASVTMPKVSKEFLESHLGLVSTTKTSTTNVRNRNTNIRLVCETINGLVLQPGEYFNYNEYVGERTAEKGYKEAGGIYDGAMRDELGGGICQVSGTMYHSVVKADLQVDQRHPHSWPSGYVPIGTDATVTWGGANFQFTNTSDYPVAIHAEYKPKDNGNGGWCTVEIFGRPIPDGMTIEFIGVVHSSTAPTTVEYVADPTKPVGVKKTERDPHNAISASGYQVFYKDGEEVRRVKVSSSYYRLITAKILVGVLDPDGITIHSIDPLTGEVIMTPTPTPTPDPTTTSSSGETTPSSSESSESSGDPTSSSSE